MGKTCGDERDDLFPIQGNTETNGGTGLLEPHTLTEEEMIDELEFIHSIL